MTIRQHHLTIAPSTDTWVSPQGEGQFDVTTDEGYLVDFLAVVRHIMRDRSDCAFIPHIVSAIVHPTNEYGHNLTVEVQYTTRYRAVYAAALNGGVSSVTCYMD